MTTFKVGDIVRLNNGEKPKIVLAVATDEDVAERRVHIAGGLSGKGMGRRSMSGRYIATRYLNQLPQHDDLTRVRRVEDFVHFKENDTMNRLYQTKAQPVRYGTWLAVNSAGLIVLEMRGEGGTVEAFETSAIEEVKPYTYQCRVIASKTRTVGTTVVLEGKVGQADKGDLVVRPSGTIYLVTEVDNKREPSGKFYGSVFKADSFVGEEGRNG